MTPELQASFVKFGLSEELRKFFESNGVADMEDFALMAPKEDDIDLKIVQKIDPKIPGAKDIKTAIVIAKLWRACRRSLDVSDKVKSSGDDGDAEIGLDDPTKSSLLTAWTSRHNFILSDVRLLIDTLQGRLYRNVTATKPSFPVLFLEQLRYLGSLERKTHLALLIKPGENAKGQNVIADVVSGNFELFTRARALMTTVAYVSIHKPSWFAYEDAEFVTEKLLTFINQEFSGQRPPLSFYVNAWAYTMKRWSEAVRTNSATLSSVVRSTSGWEHLWTMWQPSAIVPAESPPIFSAPDNRELVAEVERMRKLASQYQGERDRAIRAQHVPANVPHPRQQQDNDGNRDNGGGNQRCAARKGGKGGKGAGREGGFSDRNDKRKGNQQGGGNKTRR